jgi:hypothetical protein
MGSARPAAAKEATTGAARAIHLQLAREYEERAAKILVKE